MEIKKIFELGMYPYELPISINDPIEEIEKIKSFFDKNLKKLERLIPEAGSSEENSLKPFPNIEFKISLSDEIKAGCKLVSNNTYIIFISYASLVFIYDLFNRMFSYKNIFKEIGNSEEEELEDPSLLNYGILEQKGIFPKNVTRKYFAGMLIDQALWFLFQHELSHIIFGHVDYNIFNKNKLDSLTRKTLELDADCHAMRWLLDETIRLLNNNNNKDLYPLSIDKYIEYSFLSAYTLMRLSYGRSQILVNYEFEQEQSSPTHPSWRLRQYIVIETGLKHIKNNYSEIICPKIFPENVASIILKTEKAYETMTGNKPIDKIEDLPSIMHFSSPHVKKFLDHWKLIKPKLEPFSFIKLTK
jgi:hypothetical protein